MRACVTPSEHHTAFASVLERDAINSSRDVHFERTRLAPRQTPSGAPVMVPADGLEAFAVEHHHIGPRRDGAARERGMRTMRRRSPGPRSKNEIFEVPPAPDHPKEAIATSVNTVMNKPREGVRRSHDRHSTGKKDDDCDATIVGRSLPPSVRVPTPGSQLRVTFRTVAASGQFQRLELHPSLGPHESGQW